MKYSLKNRLSYAISIALAVVYVGLSLGLYAATRRDAYDAFVAHLRNEAETLGHMVEEHSRVRFQFEYDGVGDFEAVTRPAYFQIWHPNGDVLARSRRLGTGDLPVPVGSRAETSTYRATLPDGRPGLIVAVPVIARYESHSVPTPPPVRFKPLVVVARSTVDLSHRLDRLALWLLLLGVAIVGTGSLVASVVVRRALRPADDLAREIAAIDARHLGQRIATDNLPSELLPPVDKLNEVFLRLRQSFERERRFTADVSHELRTPLTALKAVIAVTRSRERTSDEYRQALDTAAQVANGLLVTAENLLMLTRLDAGNAALATTSFSLHGLVDEVWRLHASPAAKRRLTFENEIPPDHLVVGDREKLRLVASNLLSNAVSYTEEGGWIAVRSGDTDGVLLDVVDSGPAIAPEVLPHVFERFVRGDAARNSDDGHVGIGLSLVDALCRVMRLRAGAENLNDGVVRFRVSRAA